MTFQSMKTQKNIVSKEISAKKKALLKVKTV